MSSKKRPNYPRLFRGLVVALLACCLPGCSLFVMAGKMFFGDPKIPSAFRTSTHVNLAKEKKKVLVVCSTPEAIKNDFPSINFDLLNGLSQRLKRRGIQVVKLAAVATWMDDNGGDWEDASELAQEFDTDYIIHVDLQQFHYKEENSPTLFRGRANGNVFVYKVQKVDDAKEAVQVFVSEFTSEWPKFRPIPVGEMSARSFTKKYLDRVCDQLGQLFYDTRSSELFE